jgi:hypothetical protein
MCNSNDKYLRFRHINWINCLHSGSKYWNVVCVLGQDCDLKGL